MKVKRSIQIGGVDYTDKLISVSDINVGVRDLGIGFVSDISVDIVFDTNLLDARGQEAIVGILVDGKSYTYKGKVREINVEGNKATLNISHILSSIRFLPLKTIRVLQDDLEWKVFTVPVIYGYGRYFTVKQRALRTVDLGELPNVRKYRWLIGDKTFSGSVQEGDAYCIDDFSVFAENKNTVDTNLHDWLELIELVETPTNYRRYKIKAYQINDKYILVLHHLNVNVYGGKNNGDGTISYTQIPETGIGDYVIDDKYDEIKVEHVNKGQIGVYAPSVSIYYTEPATSENEIIGKRKIITYNYDKPADIAKDILQINGYTANIKGYGPNVSLNFQSEQSYEEILQKVSEMGILYVVPNLNDSFDIVPAGGTPVLTLSESDFVERSFKLRMREVNITKLKVIWGDEQEESYYGTGEKLKEYKADFIVDQTSVDNFASAYLDYYRKQTFVEFETPIYQSYLDLNVGDVVNIQYSRYGINKNFQVIEKSIRKDTIKFKCKEV